MKTRPRWCFFLWALLHHIMPMKKYPASRWGSTARGPAVVAVLADWCGHCQRAKPELAAAADRLGGAVPVLGLDADANPGIVEDWGVQGFPAVFFVTPTGARREYEGARTAKAISDWACAQSGKCDYSR